MPGLCGARDGARIQYGMAYITQERAGQFESGMVVLGGCFLIEGGVWDWHCNVCGLDFIEARKAMIRALATLLRPPGTGSSCLTLLDSPDVDILEVVIPDGLDLGREPGHV